jgi:hypothetical protein
MGEHLTSFGSIVAFTGDFEAVASRMMASSKENTSSPPPDFNGTLNPFSKAEEQSLHLAISVYGKNWGKVAKLIGSRTVSLSFDIHFLESYLTSRISGSKSLFIRHWKLNSSSLSSERVIQL